ncbi:RNA pseudouridine synthase [Planococcaceae bacterium Storch 2/2-2]|nr:RNA pseudouridine synthase [Planococcaceae bacterium Storch 2/2-2]
MKLTFTVSEREEGELLRSFLRQKNISRRSLTTIKFSGGRLEVNGTEVDVRHKLRAGDRVDVTFPAECCKPSIVRTPMDLAIVYEDEQLLVLEKPQGVATIPSRDHPDDSLVNGVAHYFDERGIAANIHVVTRLDTHTSGLVCFAKHGHIHHLLSDQIQSGEMRRHYMALLHPGGPMLPPVIEAPIGRKEGSIIEREVRDDGHFARTIVHDVSPYGWKGETYEAARLELVTGRTHQLRVHLAHYERPIVGDSLYGEAHRRWKGQVLFCSTLSFNHPMTDERLSFHLPLAEQLEKIERVNLTKDTRNDSINSYCDLTFK